MIRVCIPVAYYPLRGDNEYTDLIGAEAETNARAVRLDCILYQFCYSYMKTVMENDNMAVLLV